MNLRTRVRRLETVAGIGVPCAECATCTPTPPDTDPRDVIAGTCGMCGGPMHYRAVGWTEREREVGAALATVHFGERWRDERTAAMACWMDRRMRERGQTDADEKTRLCPRAVFDVSARLRVAALERREREAHARWAAAIEEASDEALVIFDETDRLSDAELERIIWSGEPEKT